MNETTICSTIMCQSLRVSQLMQTLISPGAQSIHQNKSVFCQTVFNMTTMPTPAHLQPNN